MEKIANIIDSTFNIMNNIDIAIFISDIETSDILFINNKMKEEFNLTDSVIGKNSFDVFGSNRGVNCKQKFIDKGLDENFSYTIWEEFNSKNNKYYKNIDSFIQWTNENCVHMRQYFDISEKKILQEQLEERKLEVERASDVKSNFLSRMKNNLNEPMNSIIGLSRVAYQTKSFSKINKCLDRIDSETKKLSSSVNDVFDMAKIENNDLDLILEPFSLENMLIGVSNEISQMCYRKNQIFQIRMDMEMPAYFTGDEYRISQVLKNLLFNSVKNTPEGGKIQVEVNQVNLINNISTIDICVSDTGNGVEEKLQKNIIKLFEETNIDKINSYDGIGLGLPISKIIVNMMKGEMRFYSNKNVGTSFSFTIKLEVFENKFFNRKFVSGTNIKNLNVLLLNSSYETCEYFKKIMDGFKIDSDVVMTDFNLVEKLNNGKIINRPYNILFLEENINKNKNMEIIKLVKENFEHTKIVLITSKNNNEIEKDYSSLNITHSITNPIFPSQLLDIINQIINVDNKNQLLYFSKKYNFTGKHILLVEDVEINQEIIAKSLEETNLEISYAENGLIALEMFKYEFDKYDLILMDVNMPEMDGLEATKKIRKLDFEKAKEIPIIAMTANIFDKDIKECIQAGMNDHVGKPIDIEEILEKLELFLPKGNTLEDNLVIERYINIDEALIRVRGNKKVYKALLNNFYKNTRFEHLKKEIKNNNYEKALKISHAIKGVSANLALKEIYATLNLLEEDVLNGKDSKEILKETEKAVDNTLLCINKYLELED